jgi:hypothetical protein
MYRVTISAPGFKKFVRESVDLRSGTVLAVNASLEIGATADTVEVTGATPLLETETSATGQLTEGDYFSRLPFYQRSSHTALLIVPGVTVSSGAFAMNMGGFTINGESDSRLGYFEDGMYGSGPGMTTDTIQNTIAEVKVLTTTLPAEYGHSAGGNISVVKKTGTNQVHGLVSDYGRYGGMSHRKYFDQYRLDQPRPELGLAKGDLILVQNPDANLSGPVYLPKIYDGRNKTFFMFAVQRYIEKQGKQQMYTVPTVAAKNGDFSFPETPATIKVNPIYDPRSTALTNGVWSRQPFSLNLIPKSQWDPVATKFMSLNPWTAPNIAGSPSTTGPSSNYYNSYQKRVFWENYSVRLDHQLTSSFKGFATWTYNSRTERSPRPELANSIFDDSLNKSMYYQNTAGMGGTWVISPTLISETRASYYRYENNVASIAYGQDWGKFFGIPNIGAKSWPTGMPLSIGNGSENVQETFTVKEDVSKLMGKHAFKAGYELMRRRTNSYGITNDAGSFGFAGTNGLSANGSSITNTGGFSLAAFMVGAISSYSVSTNLLSTLPRAWSHSFYLQDDWKVLPTLTANLGVRYMLESTPNNKYGQQSNFDPLAPDNTAIGSFGVVTHPTGSMYNRDWNNFQPRVGLAWHPLTKLVIRTGFALNTVDNGAQSPPTTEYGSVSATWSQASGNYFPLGQISQGPDWSKFSWAVPRADGSIPFSGTNYSSRNVTWVNPNRVNPYTMNWTFSIQYALGANYLLEASYTGDRGRKGTENWTMNAVSYDWARNLLQTDPTTFSKMEGNSQAYKPWTNFGSVTFQGQGASSNYNAGTIKLEKRYSYGLSFLAFYTYAKNMTASTSSPFQSRAMDQGRSGSDRTHSFNGSMNYELPVGKGRHFLNRGGVWNLLLGGYDMVWTYAVGSGMPLTFGYSGSPYKYMPGNVVTRGGRPDSLGQSAHLREGWQDLGGDRWTAANQNKMIESMNYFAYPAAYTQGNVGRATMDSYRFIAANASLAKEIKVKERLTIQLRYDFQNPFKWYTWDSPNTTVNFTSPTSFGTVLTEGAGCAACLGGMPIQNLTLAVKW